MVPSISSRAQRISAHERVEKSLAISLPLAATTLGVASAVSLAYEVLLTRLFSLLFEYHFVFVATSLAICGLGLGAAIGAWLLARTALDMVKPGRLVLALALALAIDSLLFSVLPWAGSVYFQAILALPPFVLIGLLTAIIFTSRPHESARLYASDLLGAAVGSIFVLLLIVWSGVFTAILWLALFAAVLAIPLSYSGGDRAWLKYTVGGAALIALLVLMGQALDLPRFNAAAIGGAPPDKTMLGVLQDSTQNAHIAETTWGPFARLDLVETSDPDTKLVFTDGGAGSYMIHFDGDLNKVRDLQADPDYMPFAQGTPTDTLILGAGAGKDVVLALLAGSKNITAVELNQDVVDLTRRYAAFNGNILDRQGVHTVVSDGRSFVEQTSQQYDLIYLNLVYSQAAGHEGSPLAESYVFTEEALRSYWRHLKPGGTIGIVSHNGFEGSRALLTAIAALRSEGLVMRQALDRVMLYTAQSNDPNASTSVLLMTRNFLNDADLSNSVKLADSLGMREMYVPSIFELPLKDLVKGTADIYTFARNGDYNLVPTSDDRPFFYQLQWGLPVSLVILLVLTSLVVLIYLGASITAHGRTKGGIGMLALFFAVLGAAYMLVLVPLVQRYYLLLGNPTLALVVTLEGLLFGAGLGALLSSRLRGTLVRPVTLALVVLVVLLVAHALLYPLISGNLLQASLPIRIAAILLFTLPVGVLIGLPFPSGLRIAGGSVPRAVPTLWGLNALSAVLGSALASAVAMLYGFQVVLLVAAGLYAVAAILINFIRQRGTAV